MTLGSRISTLFFIPVLVALVAAPLHALPDIRSNKSLGNWYNFVRSMSLHTDSRAIVFFDTDLLVAGRDAGVWGERQVLRRQVGRVVAQNRGPDIVVYDFDEIYTLGPRGERLPASIVLYGRRPAAIVADGQISNWPQDWSNPLRIDANNSFDPNSPQMTLPPWLKFRGDKAPSTARGGDGYAIVDPTFGSVTVGAGSGGYGTPGADGYGTHLPGFPPGRGGLARFSWNVLRPGSPGGDVIERWAGGERYRGGAAGGAVWIKSGGRLEVATIDARGEGGREVTQRWPGGGSGGHVIIESPEIPRLGYVRLDGDIGGGNGVLEFRGTPGMPDFFDSGHIYGGPESGAVPVGLPRGVTFSRREPQLEGEIKEVSRPRAPAPTVTVSAPRLVTKHRTFEVMASASTASGRTAANIRYRLRAPGAKLFGPWTSKPLPSGGERRKSLRLDMTSRTQGNWQAEVVAEDTSGRRSTGKVVEVLVDHTKPTVFLDRESVIRLKDQPGGYKLETFIGDPSSHPAVASEPVRVEYRLKQPGATKFGKWTRFALGDKDQYPSWPSATVLVPVTLKPLQSGTWRVEMRAVDLAGNISEIAVLDIRQ